MYHHEAAKATDAMKPDAERVLDFPKKIQIQTIDRCNYSCSMCPYPELHSGKDSARFEEALFNRLIDEVRQAGRMVKLCLMLQNEPLLDQRFLDLLAYSHDATDAIRSISTVTNGSVLTVDLLDKLMEFERFYLTISVNATDRERYERVHGRDLWDRINGLLSKWQGQRHRVRISFVLAADSLEEGRAFQYYWRDLGYATRFVPINARVDTKEVDARVHLIDYTYGHCHYPVDTLTVLVDGSVILCCNDWLHIERYGNLHTESISEIWNNPRFTRLRRAAVEGTLRMHPMCKNCDYPVRSSQRMNLEALISAPASRPVAGAVPPIMHQSRIRFNFDDETVPILVWKIDAELGAVVALTAKFLCLLPVDVWFEFRIGHTGVFNFGSLEPVWCPGKISQVQADVDLEDIALFRIDLDKSAEAFQLFPWYCADWA